MALKISELEVRLSGGATNNNPLLSLGGLMSTEADGTVISQLASAPTTVTGVTIDNAYANAVGNGVLTWNGDTSVLTWQPFGAAQGTDTVIADTGATPTEYVLGGSNGYLIVTVIYSDMVASGIVSDADISINNNLSNVFDAVSAAQSTDGLVEYRCLYIYNSSGVDSAFDVRIWMKQQPVGPDEIDIALDPAGVGNGSVDGVAIGPLQAGAGGTAEEDGTDLLAGLTWVRPSTQATGLLMGTLAPGDVYAFWERRTVYPESTEQVPNDTSKIGISALL